MKENLLDLEQSRCKQKPRGKPAEPEWIGMAAVLLVLPISSQSSWVWDLPVWAAALGCHPTLAWDLAAI